MQTSEPVWLSPELLIAADHPALAGHFPGDPLVPGVMILERVIEQVERQRRQVEALAQAKFLHPLRANQPFRIELLMNAENRWRFRCYRQDGDSQQLLAQGQLMLTPGAVLPELDATQAPV